MVEGQAQTAEGGSATPVVLGDWTNAVNNVAVVDLLIVGRGATSNLVNSYHRREVFFLGFNRTISRYVGILLARPEEIEQMATAEAAVVRSGDTDVALQLDGPTGAGNVEVVDWSWSGTITLFQIPWENPYNILGDLSTNKFQGTMTSMTSGDIVADAPGPGATYSTYFDGTSDYVTMGDVLTLDRTAVWSVSLWFKCEPGEGGKFYTKVRSTDPYGVGFGLGTANGDFNAELIHNYPAARIGITGNTTGFDDGNWHHIVYTWDGDATPGAGGFTVRVDGNVEAYTVTANTLGVESISNTGSTLIGGRTASPSYYIGKLCHVSVYNIELSDAEVAEIYNAGDPPDLLALSTAANLVFWNRVGD
jgi:hypothetical protein